MATAWSDRSAVGGTGAAGPLAGPVAARAFAPPTAEEVRTAIRLGWFVAELRGRHWWRGPRPPVAPVPVDPPFGLPLRPERSEVDSRRVARDAAAALAERLGVARGSDGPTFGERMQVLAGPLEGDGGRLLEPPGHGEPDDAVRVRDVAWTAVASLVRDWDCSIQDALTSRSDALANGYLLGRGLAECYWALGPDDAPAHPAPSDGWDFLLGAGRHAELSRLVGRIAPYVPALTPTAVAGSLAAWAEVAADPAWRGARDARAKLHEQYRQWYELVVLGREPTTYVRPYALLRGWRTTLRAFGAFWPQLLVAAVSAAAMAAVAFLVGTGRGGAVPTTLLGFSGVVGLAAAGVVARAKSASQRLLTRLRQDVYGDLVAVAVTVVPDLPATGTGGRHAASVERRVHDAVRARRITPVGPPPAP